MSPIRLQNKIERLLAELYENCPKRILNSKNQSWTSWIGTKKSEHILNKYKASYLSEGASRLAVEIAHAGKKYAFKICHTQFVDGVISGELDDDNHVEILAVQRLKKSIWTRSLVLPMVLHYRSKIAGWISVWPKAYDYELYNQSLIKNKKYDEIREDLISRLTSDYHEGNVVYWKGYVWLIDINIDDGNDHIVQKRHKKIASSKKYRKSYQETSRIVRAIA